MLNVSTQNSNVKVKKFETPLEAVSQAQQEAAATGATVLPAILFQQGSRAMLSTAFPIPIVRSRLQLNPTKKAGTVDEVRSATNRPTMPEHVENVKNYIKSNIGGTYIVPPLTLNVRQPINVYMADFPSALMVVHLVLPLTARLEITDGGHRKAAIDSLAAELSDENLARLDQDAISVMITVEEDMSQIHQDFADCSKTKALPKSQLAAYDRRNPANGVVLDLIERCELFKGKIDSTSKTLSKKSTKLFLTNQVRQMVKEMLTGQYAMADEAFEAKAKELLGSSEDPRYKDIVSKFTAFVDRVTSAISVLKEISELSEGPPRYRITELREEGWVCLMATGLVIIGRIGFELFKNQMADWEEYADKLGAIDWRKTGAIWQGNIIMDGRVMTQQTPVKTAVAVVRKSIGLLPAQGELPTDETELSTDQGELPAKQAVVSAA
jgi:DGQHR domain-containing protein